MPAPRDQYDVVVVGSGVAGLSVALGLAGHRRVALITSGELSSGSTAWAQGGIAAAIGPADSPRRHAADTITAGAGMCDPAAVGVLTSAARGRLDDLIAAGAIFDRDPGGRLALTREGGHHQRRVVHAGGDATGAEVSRALRAALQHSPVDVLDHTAVTELRCASHVTGTQVVGLSATRTLADGSSIQLAIDARAIVLATGGIGGVYASSTNPVEVTGDGLALALRAGATLVDLEFVQFHPTALRLPAATGQLPLVTEAMRGEGAILRDQAGRAIMAGQHPLRDLAPRDVVARRIDEVMADRVGGVANLVGLDATALGHDVLRDRFPTVYASCLAHGIDPVDEPIPVTPAQHFSCGGVRTDADGTTDVVGLYAVGEVAATGVHGANRLASNSLVEGMVFGRRIAARLREQLPPLRSHRIELASPMPSVGPAAIDVIRATMSRHAGVRRSPAGLAAATAALDALCLDGATATSDAANRWTVAAAILTAATARRESRGCHWRSDYPASREAWRHRIELRLDGDGRPIATVPTRLEQTA